MPESDHDGTKDTGREKEAEMPDEEDEIEDLDIDRLIEEETWYFRKKPRSKARIEAEELLKGVDLVGDRRLAVVDLETGEVLRFDSFPEAQEFMKGKRGRWYVTTPDLSRMTAGKP